MTDTPVYPGVYIKEASTGGHTISGVETSITAFIGRASTGRENEPAEISSFEEFAKLFGGLDLQSSMSFAVSDFFSNGGKKALIIRINETSNHIDDNLIIGDSKDQTGLYALEKVDSFNLLCIPPINKNEDISNSVVKAAAQYCEDRNAMLILDPKSAWETVEIAKSDLAAPLTNLGTNSKNAAVFFPRICKPNPLKNNEIEMFVPCGAIAGVISRTDTTKGFWKAPAGLDATLEGVAGLSANISDEENADLNRLGCNCLRTFPDKAPVMWGSRTLQGNDNLSSEWKYISVRRTALYIQESILHGTEWVVFEPNDELLWSKIRLSVGAFMNNLFKQGAFQGNSAQYAYFVKCDSETTTQDDIKIGCVNFLVGFAALKPAEFVTIKIQQVFQSTI